MVPEHIYTTLNGGYSDNPECHAEAGTDVVVYEYKLARRLIVSADVQVKVEKKKQ